MRVQPTLIRLLALLGLMSILLSACGNNEPAAPPTSAAGPALIFFYTDP